MVLIVHYPAQVFDWQGIQNMAGGPIYASSAYPADTSGPIRG
jgi:hypothetical protein